MEPEQRPCGRSEPSTEINQKQARLAGAQSTGGRVCNTNCKGSGALQATSLSQDQGEVPGRTLSDMNFKKPLWLLCGEWIGGIRVDMDGSARLLL